ncbi:Ig-like domain-containing protein [Carboxydocella sp. ULO1]|uniref:Ig-like domain-containing protein n=1 Tax=Carboxydocella sp. ULO1 TaxID=1926599 RepID=UPI0009AC300B|nr:Ig-like domain-containing protein [Carboxydocella sp. ULO1]GAW29178.1 (4Fe-4S)-binding protein [Carboxydocella sp. ULO1]
MARMGKFIDLSKCLGCRGCQTACKQWNNLPAEIEGFSGSYQTHRDTLPRTYTIVKMKEIEENGKLEWHFRKHQCLHCGEPTCVRVCPHKARKQMPEGAVYRQGGCRGCAYCVVKCPFGVPKIGSDKKSYSCWLCYDRITNNLKPACATACPTGAITFGVWDELVNQARTRLGEVLSRWPKANLYGADFLGGTGVFYLLLREPEFYDLPVNPRVPAPGSWYGSANSTPECYTCHDSEPVANVIHPAEGQTVSGTIQVTAYADSQQTITRVEFYLDGALIGTATGTPYTINLDTTRYSNGLHTLKAKPYTAISSGESKTTTFYIQNTQPAPGSAPDTTPPKVSFLVPAANSSLKGTVVVKVSATDNVAVAKVELYVRDQLAGVKLEAPFDFTLDTSKYPGGKATLKAVAYDSAGNKASAQINVKFTR